jgi:sigma-E factor negative regulatory protein RseC
MEAQAIVRQVEGSDAVIELASRSGGCGRCHEPGGCGGSSVVGQVFGPRCSVFRVPNTIDAKPGEQVLVRLGDRDMLRAALMVYFLPIVMLVAGAFLGLTLAENAGDRATFLGGALGFVAALVAVVRFQARERTRGRLQPVLTRGRPSTR